MPEPADKNLYNRVKRKVYKDIPLHSAYRSGHLVKKYKEAYAKKYGAQKKPYKGKKPTRREPGIGRWFAEEWVNQRGKVGYQRKDDVYRPSKRISSKTPITHGELTKGEIKRAQKKKKEVGRVDRFRAKNKNNENNKNKKMQKKQSGGKGKPIKKDGRYIFKDYPNFKPNLSPREMFKLGSFGGTYWRPIRSSVTNQKYKNVHKKYPKSWWKDIPEKHLSTSFDKYDKRINKYGVKVGTTLEFWESKDWIKPSHPYGWVHWYCDFFSGKRCADDKRQIGRWERLAGKKGRFSRFLVTQILKKSQKESPIDDFDNENISPKIRQVLQHWGYVLTKADMKKELKRRGIKI